VCTRESKSRSLSPPHSPAFTPALTHRRYKQWLSTFRSGRDDNVNTQYHNMCVLVIAVAASAAAVVVVMRADDVI
jgi:hypothetical protein